jgi:tricorn protease
VNVKVGDYVLEVDGEELKGEDNPYRLLQHKTHPVTLKVNDRPSLDGARGHLQPGRQRGDLLYLDRVRRTGSWWRGYSTAGRLPPHRTWERWLYEFVKWFYPQIRKEGLVVDVRSNGGGNVSQWIIERLDTRLLGTRFGRASDEPTTYPGTVFHGHKVCLVNETSASDGDIFPHYFRKAGLGPLIDKRT